MGGKTRSQSSRAPGGRIAPGRTAARAAEIDAILRDTWGEAHCELDHDSAFQLLVAAILSAQCTNARINQVTPALFARYPDPRALADADPDALEALVRPTGFFRMKARALRAVARALCDRHGGEVPGTLRALTALPGVARKTAVQVLGVWFGRAAGIAVDTHVQRASRRLELTAETAPDAIERDLIALFPRARWIDLAQQLTWHGRRLCHARNPACGKCPLVPLCPSAAP